MADIINRIDEYITEKDSTSSELKQIKTTIKKIVSRIITSNSKEDIQYLSSLIVLSSNGRNLPKVINLINK